MLLNLVHVIRIICASAVVVPEVVAYVCCNVPDEHACGEINTAADGGLNQGFHFWKLKFIRVTDKEDKQDISEISDQIQIKFNLNLSKFKQNLYEKDRYFFIDSYG